MKKLATTIIFLITILTYSQQKIKLSGGLESNSAWYLNDSGLQTTHPEAPFRSNNYLLLNADYKNFKAGIQVESYEPNSILNYNPQYKGTNVGTYFLQYKSKKIDLTAGYFYEQLGSGLLLRTWEDRTIGINNALRGGRMVYNPTDYIKFMALYGNQRSGFTVANSDIFAFDTEVALDKIMKFETTNLSFGFSFVGRNEKTNIQNPNFETLTTAYGGRINLSHKSYYFSTEFDYKSKDAIKEGNTFLNNDFVKSGNALLMNFGYSEKGLGIDATLRRIENMGFYSERNAKGNIYNDKIINFIPALTKQHHASLSNIYTYQAQPNVTITDIVKAKAGEIGGQIDVFYNFKKGTPIGGKYGTKVAFNTSNWFDLDGKYTPSNPDENQLPNYSVNFMALGQKYFADYNVEVSKKWNDKWSGLFSYINQYYNTNLIEETHGEVNTNIVSAESTYKINQKKSIKLNLEHLWADADKKNWAAGSLELYLNSKFAVYTNDLYNYGNDDATKKTHYYNFGGSYNKGSSRIALNYGRQRGGYVCSGGVCRIVPESTGFTISLSSSF